MTRAKGTLLITGANGALGSAIVSNVVSSPELQIAYHGIYAVRDATSATRTLDAALAQSQSSNSIPNSHSYDKLSLDLSLPSSVRQAANSINARVAAKEIPPIRALVFNAGYQEFGTQTWTADGLDTTFAANYLGHWLLALMLLQSMDQKTGRIIWISSWSHYPADSRNMAQSAYVQEKYKTAIQGDLEPIAKGTWSANKDDTTGWEAGWRRYGASKLCSIAMIHELQRRLDRDPILHNISVLAVDPGAMAGGMVRRSDSWIIRVFIMQVLVPALAILLIRFFPNGPFRTTAKSARDIVAAAFDCGPPLGERPKGLFLNGSELGEYNPEAKDPRNWEIIWKGSVKYAGLTEGETVLQNWE